MYISYSGHKKWDTCKFSYWHEYINKTAQEVDDRLGSIYGSTVGVLFEDFYTLKLWAQKEPVEALQARVESTLRKTIDSQTLPSKGRPGGTLKWKGDGPGQNPTGMYVNMAELVADIRDSVPRGIRTIRRHRLLGPRADAEYKLDYTVEGNVIGGRADFIIQRIAPDSDLVIIDGKGTKHKNRVDPKQLHWYATLNWLHTGKLPNKLAFLFWKFQPDEAVDWISISESEAESLLEEVLEAFKEITRLEEIAPKGTSPKQAIGVFTPKPSENNCRFCQYAVHCPKGADIQQRIKTRADAAQKKRLNMIQE